MIMILAALTFRRVVKEHASSSIFDCIDKIDSKIWVVIEAKAIVFGVLFAIRIHDLSCGNFGHQLPKWRSFRTFPVDIIDLFRVWYQLGLSQAFTILIYGNILELWHIKSVAELMKVVTGNCERVFVLWIRDVRYIIQLALIYPLHEQLKPRWFNVW